MSKPHFLRTVASAALLAAALSAGPVLAQTGRALQDSDYHPGGISGQTNQSRPYITGGVSIEEASALEANRRDYRLWIVTADRSGAWLAGARARLLDAVGTTVLETTLEGPYLLVDLAPGRYTVEVTLGGQTQTRTVSVGTRGTRQLVVHFDTGAEVSPEMPDRQVTPPSIGEADAAMPAIPR